MERISLGIPGLALVVLAASAAWLHDASHPTEEARLQRHFATVDAELTSRDVSRLSQQQRAGRARNIEVLREYARAGVFPHNHDFEQPTPYFRDQHGTLCAMAYLIARSGRVDLVDKVARSANNAFLPELARDPELQAWLDANGLTVAEAARIQPQYGPAPGFDEDDDAGYKIASVAASVVSGGAITWTLLSNPRRTGYAPGIVTSLVGLGDLVLAAAGVINEQDDFGGGLSQSEEHLAGLNAVVGAVTTVAGITYIVRVMSARGERVQPATSSSRFEKWQPLLFNDSKGRTQVGVNVKF